MCISFPLTAANGLCNAADAAPLAVPLWGICSRDTEILEQRRSDALNKILSLCTAFPNHNNPATMITALKAHPLDPEMER